MEFKDYLMKEFNLSESSAKDYIGRFNGILKRGLYNGEDEITNKLKVAIENEFPKSKVHYLLALERYIQYKKVKDKSSRLVR